jgi:hypothetical protein
MMKFNTSLSFVAIAVVVVGNNILSSVDGFQWMSKFKVPVYDPNQERVQEKFGDKSTCHKTLSDGEILHIVRLFSKTRFIFIRLFPQQSLL